MAQSKTDLSISTNAPDTKNDYHFGMCMDANSQQVFVGSLSNKQANLAGGVYVFDAKTIKQATKPLQFIAPKNLNAESYFGTAIAAQSDRLLIGASNATILANANKVLAGGTAYLYKNVGKQWQELALLQAPNAHAYEQFGATVALNKQCALIATAPKSKQPVVYVYDISTPKCLYQQTLVPQTSAAEFGKAMLLNKTDAFISAPQANDKGGVVFWFALEGKRWVEKQQIVPICPVFEANANREALSFAPTANKFGWAMATDQQTLAIGAPMENMGAGAVYIFEQQNGIWTQTQRITLPNKTEPFIGFGETIALQNNILWIGASGNGDVPSTVYAYARVNNQWLPTKHIYLSPTPNDGLGKSIVATNNNTLIMGAPNTLTDNMPQGAIYSCTYEPTELIKEAVAQQEQQEQQVAVKETVMPIKPVVDIVPTSAPAHIPNTTLPNATLLPLEITSNNSNAIITTEGKLTIYPNPSEQGIFYVESMLDFANDIATHLTISNNQGKAIHAVYTLLAPNKIQIQIQLPAPAGMYYLQINHHTYQLIIGN